MTWNEFFSLETGVSGIEVIGLPSKVAIVLRRGPHLGFLPPVTKFRVAASRLHTLDQNEFTRSGDFDLKCTPLTYISGCLICICCCLDFV